MRVETSGRGGPHPSRLRQRHLVRPRYVWGGLAAAIAGSVALGAGIAILSWTLAVMGALFLTGGASVSLLGGVLNDARTELSLGKELREVISADVHPGLAPGEVMKGSSAVRVRSVTTTRHRLRPLPTAALGRPAGGLLMLVALAQYALTCSVVAQTPTGHVNALRDMSLGIVIGLAGFRLLTVPGAHGITAGAALFAGLLLVLQGLLGHHDHSALRSVEMTSGALVVVCAITAWLSPDADAGVEEPMNRAM